jgi:nuclear pore complex protein Nup62
VITMLFFLQPISFYITVMFGASSTTASNIFGASANTATSTGGIFGQSNGGSGGLFKTNPNTNLFGAPTVGSTPSNLFGAPTNTSTAPLFGSPGTTNTSSTLFGSTSSSQPSLFSKQAVPSSTTNPTSQLGLTSTFTAPAPSGFLGVTAAPASSQSPGGLFSTTSNTTSSVGGLFGSKSTAVANKPSTVASTGLTFNVQTTSTSSGLSLSTSSAGASSTTNQTLSSLLTAPSLSSGLLPTTTSAVSALSGLGTTTTASLGGSVSAGSGSGLTYRQLEENVNKWNDDLDELERQFIAQATQINAWDRVVLENGDKITALNEELKKIKDNQDRLDHELDFISTQQKDLEALIAPLEDTLANSGLTKPHDVADDQRQDTFVMAENVDCELKQMVQDLREIIESVNSNTSNEEIAAISPFAQLERVLNVHVDSLQWVDQNLEMITKRVDHIQIPRC